MTICIAALAENGKKLLLMSDQMVTASIPIEYEFETENVRKICALTQNSYALNAGNALFASEIISNSKKTIKMEQVKKDKENMLAIEEIAEIARKEYIKRRLAFATQLTLEPRGLNLDSYYENQKNFAPAIISTIENEFESLDMDVELIIAGNSIDENCRLFSITNPGILICHDEIGFICTGIGAPHAAYHFIDRNYNKDMTADEVNEIMEGAKQRSEKAPGVGAKTTKKEL